MRQTHANVPKNKNNYKNSHNHIYNDNSSGHLTKCPFTVFPKYDMIIKTFLEKAAMMFPFLTLDDGTEIVHSEKLENGRVKFYIERPDEKDCFHHATCYLPDYEWTDNYGFTPDEIQNFQQIISIATYRDYEGLKATALQQKRFEYVTSCENAIPQIE